MSGTGKRVVFSSLTAHWRYVNRKYQNGVHTQAAPPPREGTRASVALVSDVNASQHVYIR